MLCIWRVLFFCTWQLRTKINGSKQYIRNWALRQCNRRERNGCRYPLGGLEERINWPAWGAEICRGLHRSLPSPKPSSPASVFWRQQACRDRCTSTKCNHRYSGTSPHYLSWHYTPVHVSIYLWTCAGVNVGHRWNLSHRSRFSLHKNIIQCPVFQKWSYLISFLLCPPVV